MLDSIGDLPVYSFSAILCTQGLDEKGEWKSRWQAQVSELKRRSVSKNSNENMSWGARMRRRREESYNGL